eukprot:403340608
MKEQTKLIQLIEKECMCLLKIDIKFDNKQSIIKVSPGIKISNLIKNTLMIMQSSHEIQQLIFNDKETIYRLKISNDLSNQQDKNQLNDDIPKDVQEIINNLTEKCKLQLKIMNNQKLEQHVEFNKDMKQVVQQRNFDVVLFKQLQKVVEQNQEHNLIEAGSMINLEFDLSFDIMSYQILLEIVDGSMNKQVLEFKNSTNDLNLNLLLDKQDVMKWQILPSQKLVFTNEKEVKMKYEACQWAIQLEVDSDEFFLDGEITHNISIDPQQLLDKDLIEQGFELKMQNKFNNRTKSSFIRIKYQKVSNNHLILELIQEDQQNQLPSKSVFRVQTNIEIKTSFFPWSKAFDRTDKADICFDKYESIVPQIYENQGHLTKIVMDYITTKVLHSLHKIAYHSNFLGKFPSIFGETKLAITNSFHSSNKILAMFPVMNETAKGVAKFIYTLSSSFGSNLIKLAFGKGKSDSQQFLEEFHDKFYQVSFDWFCINLNNITKDHISQYILGKQIHKNYLIIDECFFDIQDQNIACLLVFTDYQMLLLFENEGIIKSIIMQYHYIRKIQFTPQNEQDISINQYVKLQIGLKKKSTAKLNVAYNLNILNSSMYFEVPRRNADSILSLFKQKALISNQSK